MANTDWKTNADQETVLVSEIVGEGADAHRLVKVGAWELTAFTGRGDEEPRVRDVELAQRLGFKRALDIRELISRHVEAGNVAPLTVIRTARKTGGRPAHEHWLSEADALFITAKSETPQANALTREMIHVYVLARRGLLPPQRAANAPTVDMDALASAVAAKLGPALREAKAAALPAVLLDPRFRTASIRQKVAECVLVMRRIDASRSARSHSTTVHNWLRGVASYGVSGRTWGTAPLDVYLAAVGSLDSMLAILRRLHQGDPRAKQGMLHAVG